MVKKPLHQYLVPEDCEFHVRLSPGEDPPWSEEMEDEEQLEGNKLGGTPRFIQSPEFPDDGDWKLLLQLDSSNVPFYVSFGDSGVGYAFISADSRKGRFLWQGF
jgi:uncharacterized protein YwqG